MSFIFLLLFSLFFFLLIRRPPIFSLFPYTTLFRSVPWWTPLLGLVVRAAGATLTRTSEPTARARRRAAYSPLTCRDRKSTRLNSSHVSISYAVFCLKKKKLLHYVLLSVFRFFFSLT